MLKDTLGLICKASSLRIIPLSDKSYLKLRYYQRMNKKLNLTNPKTYNEKLQWLKLYDRNPEYSKMVDKYEVKQYVANIIGEEYIIPTYGIYNKFDEINFDILPSKFVLKCTHNSGGVIICKNKDALDIEKARKTINKSLKRNYYYCGREWPYKNIKPRIIIEPYLEDKYYHELIDYKFFCFNGRFKILLICSNRAVDLEETWFDRDFNLLDIHEGGHAINSNLKKPKSYEKMIEIAEKLSKNIPFLRVDLYEINGKIYFGELTFYPASGFEKFEPEEWDRKLGDMLELPKQKLEEKNEK